MSNITEKELKQIYLFLHGWDSGDETYDDGYDTALEDFIEEAVMTTRYKENRKIDE